MAAVNPRRGARVARRPVVGGFTLIEVILATAVLAAVGALAATAMMQVRGWTHDLDAVGAGANVLRVTEMMRHQWGDRRTGISIDTKGAAVLATPERLEFVTASGVVYPEFPLVRACYVIERDYSPASSGLRWKLVYEESRIKRPGTPPMALGGLGSSRVTKTDETPMVMDLLTGISQLRWERYSTGKEEEEGGLAPAPGAKPNAAPGAEAKEGKDRSGWKTFQEDFDGDVPAVRLMGVIDGEEFTCVLVIGVSR